MRKKEKEKKISVSLKRIDQKRMDKGFDTEIEIKDVLPEIRFALNNDGYVFGMFVDSVLQGIYIIRNEADYFEKRGFTLGKKADGNSKHVLRLVYSYWNPELKDAVKDIERKILVEIKRDIFLGTVIGIEWRNILHYRRKVVGKPKMYTLGAIAGLGVGILLGRVVINSWLWALILGVLFILVGLLVTASIIHQLSIRRVKIKNTKE